MTFHIKPEMEARLVAKTQEQGLSIDTLLERLIEENETVLMFDNSNPPGLAAWHLGTLSSLRRRDIYDDVS